MAVEQPPRSASTAWRQGHILSREIIERLRLLDDGQSFDCAVIITHDCDIVAATEAEPSVEVMLGRLIDAADGNYRWAKSPRTLHVDASVADESRVLELVASDRRVVEKTSLFGPFEPDATSRLANRELRSLQRWLATRYDRPALPDEFVERLRRCEEKISRLMKGRGREISDICIRLDEGERVDRADGSPYLLDIVILYVPGENPIKAAEEADELAEDLAAVFVRTYFLDGDKWAGIELKSCFASSEEEMSIAEYRQMQRLRFEHLSLRSSQQQEAQPSGA